MAHTFCYRQCTLPQSVVTKLSNVSNVILFVVSHSPSLSAGATMGTLSDYTTLKLNFDMKLKLKHSCQNLGLCIGMCGFGKCAGSFETKAVLNDYHNFYKFLHCPLWYYCRISFHFSHSGIPQGHTSHIYKEYLHNESPLLFLNMLP